MKRKPATFQKPKNMALFELQRFINFVHTVEPELNGDELILLAAFILHGLPQVFSSSPVMLRQITNIAQAIKSQRH
jgi:hypothetical protein